MLKTLKARFKDKVRVLLKAQGMPKYQNYYLGGNSNTNHHLELTLQSVPREVYVVNCWYDPKIASYVYGVGYEGSKDRLPVPECYLKEVKNAA